MKPNLTNKKTVVFTAMSKKNFYMRMFVAKFVLDNDCVPINPFMNFDYFLADMVDMDRIRNANNNLVMRADELWVFGEISNGVKFEIDLASSLKKKVRYFKFLEDKEVEEILPEDVRYE